MAFNKDNFEKAFAKALADLTGSERITKETLKEVSRTVLEAWLETGNNAYANKLLPVLTPINKKVCIEFFKHFSGYSFDKDAGIFGGKSKKRWQASVNMAREFLEDPHNNVWTWAERHIEIEKKGFNLADVEKYIVSKHKAALANGVSDVDFMKALFKSGVSADAIVEAFNSMEFTDEEGDVVGIATQEEAPL